MSMIGIIITTPPRQLRESPGAALEVGRVAAVVVGLRMNINM